MPNTFSKKMRKISLWLGSLFVLLFLFRLLYGYYGLRTVERQTEISGDFFSNLQNLRKNYASEKIANISLPSSPSDFSSSQKYEKTATVQSKSLRFEEDEALIRKTAGQFNPYPVRERTGNKRKPRAICFYRCYPLSIRFFLSCRQTNRRPPVDDDHQGG